MFDLKLLRKDRAARGQSLVEFALVLPILLLILAAAIDLGRLSYAYVAVQNAAREGAFYGARSPLCDDNTNPSCADPNNVKWHVVNEASNLNDGSGNSLLTATVACRDSKTGALIQPISNCVDGNNYQVTVTYPFALITPILSTIVGPGFTLRAEAQATVLSDAFDPSGLEALIWVDKTGATNASAIAAACTLADAATSPNFYYQGCQDSSNIDNFLQFQENTNINYKVRVRNTGNIDLTGLTYAFTVNGASVAKPGNCATLPATMSKGAAPAYCTFSRAATSTNPGKGIDDDNVTLTASGTAAGLPNGQTASGATIKVVPGPHLAINLKAAPYRLGGSGFGTGGTPSYPATDLTLNRSAASSLTEIKNPTGWFYLTVVNQGATANNFSVSVTQQGAAISLPASCPIPSSLAASGQNGDTFSCIFPRTFNATQTYALVASASATNAVIVAGQDPAVNATTATCANNKYVVPNLIDTLNPAADGTNKTVLQARTTWQNVLTGTAFTGAFATVPAGAANSLHTVTQNQTAYTCLAANSTVSVVAQ